MAAPRSALIRSAARSAQRRAAHQRCESSVWKVKGRIRTGQHVHGRLGVTGREHREGRGIDDAETLDAVDLKVGVQDPALIERLHRAGAGGVPDGLDRVLDGPQDGRVARDGVAGEVFLVVDPDRLEGGRVEDAADLLEGLDRHLLVSERAHESSRQPER